MGSVRHPRNSTDYCCHGVPGTNSQGSQGSGVRASAAYGFRSGVDRVCRLYHDRELKEF